MEYLLADSINELLRHDNFIAVLAIVMGCSTGIIAIICGSISGVYKARSREETKRELAAYVAGMEAARVGLRTLSASMRRRASSAWVNSSPNRTRRRLLAMTKK